MIKENCFNLSYMGNYKVFCFSDLYLPKYQKSANIQYYDIGDLVPTIGYNYFFGPNLIIIDYINKVFHLIIKSIYRETIQVQNHSFKVNKDSFFNRIEFDKIIVIDIYGNFMNIHSYEDIILSMISYPKINVYLDMKQLSNPICDNSNILVSELNCFEFDRRIVVKGSLYESETLDIVNSSKVIESMKTALIKDSLEQHNLLWINYNHQFVKINLFLNYMRLMYFISKNNITYPFVYYKYNLKEFTHIGKVDKFFKNFILENSILGTMDIVDIVFTYAKFDIDYEDFIFSVMHDYLEVDFEK